MKTPNPESKRLGKKSPIYIGINIFLAIVMLLAEIFSYTVLSNPVETKYFLRVISRGILGLLLIYNSLYLLLTSKWSFLTINATRRQRVICGILIGLVGLFGVITALLGYGTNGDPRWLWQG